MSKIQQKPSNDNNNPPPHDTDKPLIPQISITHPQSKLSSHPCVSSSSPSSLSSSCFTTSSSTAASFDTSTTSTCSTTSSRNHRICMIEEKHNIVLLDPRKYDNTKVKPVCSSVRQPTAKRLRSRSPPATDTRRKSIRCEQSPATPRLCQRQSIPSPARRRINKDVRKNKLHCSGSLETSSKRVSQLGNSNRKQQSGGHQGGLSKSNTRICPMEDIDNPLISMDVFIFI